MKTKRKLSRQFHLSRQHLITFYLFIFNKWHILCFKQCPAITFPMGPFCVILTRSFSFCLNSTMILTRTDKLQPTFDGIQLVTNSRVFQSRLEHYYVDLLVEVRVIVSFLYFSHKYNVRSVSQSSFKFQIFGNLRKNHSCSPSLVKASVLFIC